MTAICINVCMCMVIQHTRIALVVYNTVNVTYLVDCAMFMRYLEVKSKLFFKMTPNLSNNKI